MHLVRFVDEMDKSVLYVNTKNSIKYASIEKVPSVGEVVSIYRQPHQMMMPELLDYKINAVNMSLAAGAKGPFTEYYTAMCRRVK